MARFYLDENIDLSLCQLLIDYGHDVLTVLDASRSSDSDDAVLAFAIEDERIVVTHNRRHFKRLHKTHEGRHCGIVICTYDPDLDALALHIHEAITANEPVAGKMIRVVRSNP